MKSSLTKIISLVLCLCIIVSNSGLCSYAFGNFNKLTDQETFRKYIRTTGDDYYELTGTRIRLDFNLLDAGDFVRENASTYEEFVSNEEADLAIAKRNHTKDKKWISISYSGAFNDVVVIQREVEILSDEDITELRTLASDVETDIDTRMKNLISAIFVKLYADLEYEETDETKEMVAIYDNLQATLSTEKPVDVTVYVVGVLVIIIATGCFCFIRKRKHNEKNNRNNMSA